MKGKAYYLRCQRFYMVGATHWEYFTGFKLLETMKLGNYHMMVSEAKCITIWWL